MPLWWLPMAAQGAGSVLKYALSQRRRAPAFEHTKRGAELQRVAQEGIYGAAARREILSDVGRRAGNIAGERRADIRGYLAARGMNRSISAAGALDRPLRDVQRNVAETAGGLARENERSKAEAKMEYARAANEWEGMRRAESRAATGELVSGLAGAAMSGFQGYMQQKSLESRNKYIEAIGQGRELPTVEGIRNMSQAELLKLSQERGVPYDTLEEIKYLHMAEQESVPKGGAPEMRGAPGEPRLEYEKPYETEPLGYSPYSGGTDVLKRHYGADALGYARALRPIEPKLPRPRASWESTSYMDESDKEARARAYNEYITDEMTNRRIAEPLPALDDAYTGGPDPIGDIHESTFARLRPKFEGKHILDNLKGLDVQVEKSKSPGPDGNYMYWMNVKLPRINETIKIGFGKHFYKNDNDAQELFNIAENTELFKGWLRAKLAIAYRATV